VDTLRAVRKLESTERILAESAWLGAEVRLAGLQRSIIEHWRRRDIATSSR
jgi:hypothetical protein